MQTDKRKFLKKSESEKPPQTTASPTLPVKLSQNQFFIGIWLFEKPRGSEFVTLSGIYRTGLLAQIDKLGYQKRYRSDNTFSYVSEHENIITSVDISQIRDSVTLLINATTEINLEYKGLTFIASIEKQHEIFYRNSPSLFNDAILGHLRNHDKPLLHDTKTEMFFPFLNTVVSVTDAGIKTIRYSDLKGVCLWKDHLINRNYNPGDGEASQFGVFITNVSECETDRMAAFHSAIGYLLHNYSAPTTARAVIAYDQEISTTNEPAGGTGKGLFSQGISQLRNTAVIDGKKIDDRNQFSYQMVTERTQCISFDDVRINFNFLMLNSNLTTGWQIEHKNKQPFRFAPNDNPKTYITSNTILKAEGITAKRRMFILEFSPFYSELAGQNKEPIVEIHGGMFFTEDWPQAEWDRFFAFMFECCVVYLQQGLKFYNLRSVGKNKLVQTTSDDFAEWILEQNIEPEKELDITENYTSFKATYYGDDSEFKQRTFTNWLKLYALSRDLKLKTWRSNGKTKANLNTKQYTSTQRAYT